MPLHLLPNARSDQSSDARPQPRPTTRRQFLAGVTALGGAALGTSVAAASPPNDKAGGIWYALVADIHIAADPARRVFNQNMADHLKAVVADILAAGEPPHGVVIAGDLAMWDGKPGDYHNLLLLLEPLRA